MATRTWLASASRKQLLSNSPVPVTIQRATQFHEFAGMVVEWTRQGDVATVPPLLVQPVAAADVGDVLAEIAAVHAEAPNAAATDWVQIVGLYGVLARADLCRRLGKTAEFRVSYERALSLAWQEPERRFLERRLRELSEMEFHCRFWARPNDYLV